MVRPTVPRYTSQQHHSLPLVSSPLLIPSPTCTFSSPVLDCGDWLMGPIISQQVTLYSIQTSTHLGDHTVVSLIALSIYLLTIIIVLLAIPGCRANLACISLHNVSRSLNIFTPLHFVMLFTHN